MNLLQIKWICISFVFFCLLFASEDSKSLRQTKSVEELTSPSSTTYEGEEVEEEQKTTNKENTRKHKGVPTKSIYFKKHPIKKCQKLVKEKDKIAKDYAEFMDITQQCVQCFWFNKKLERKSSNSIEMKFYISKENGLEVDSIEKLSGSNNPLAFSIAKNAIEKAQLCYPKLPKDSASKVRIDFKFTFSKAHGK